MTRFIVAIKLAFKSLYSNIGRTTLSILGVVIGVMSVVLVLSLGDGVRSFVIAQIETFGSDLIEIEIKTPKTEHVSSENVSSVTGGMQITTLKLDDMKEVSKISNLGDWYAGIMSQFLVNYENKNKQIFVMGVTEGMIKVDDAMKMENGEMFTDEDGRGNKKVVVIGSKLKETFFGNRNAIGENIKIKGQSFRIIGVLKERGAVAFFDFDNIVYMPVETLQKRLMGIDYIQFAMFKSKDERFNAGTIKKMTEIMRDRHDIDDPEDDDFTVMSIAEAKEMLDKVFAIINFLLISLTSISLIVGGVGIMNVMYVSVVERTSEIGLRKSLGAKESDLLWQFMWESVFITLLGGVVGVFLGFIVTVVATAISNRFGFVIDFRVTPFSVFLGLTFSFFAGLIFGLWPAKKASKISPMEALRKE